MDKTLEKYIRTEKTRTYEKICDLKQNNKGNGKHTIRRKERKKEKHT